MTVAGKLPEIMHRGLFKTISLLGRRQGPVLRRYFDWWHRTPDPWHLTTDAYERYKYQTTLGELPAEPVRRILEVGCSEGAFTELLAAAYPDAEIIGLDISDRALERARRRLEGATARVRFVHGDLLDHETATQYDLVFCAETLYYLGRDHRLRRASQRLSSLPAAGGLLVLVHPWPEARRLHAFVDASPEVGKIGERIDPDTRRPFAVSLYRAHAG